ncbi:MAG: hypothetical protein Q7U20_10615 [Caulobacter sp.]|nr:hypothetical protein [Caulobacter sp.]
MIATVCLLALNAGGASAADAPRGYLGASYGDVNVDAGTAGEADADLWTLQGLVSLPLGPGVTGELAAEAAQYDGGDTLWSPTGRIFFDVGGSRVGGFVGGTGSDGFDLTGGGLEGRFNLAPDWRLDTLLGYGSGDVDAWAARGQLRFFAGDNTRLDGYANFVSFDTDLGGLDGWAFGLGGEHLFEGTPVSLFGRLEHDELNDVDLASDSLRIGVRWNFGGGTLRDRGMDGQSSPGFAELFGGDLLFGLASALAMVPDGDGGGSGGDD